MATKQIFTSKRISNITKVATGTGSYTVDIPFVPNFIDVSFHDIKHVATTPDTVTWALAATATGYTLTVTYTAHEPRDIRHVVAKLPVDPEQTIAH